MSLQLRANVCAEIKHWGLLIQATQCWERRNIANEGDKIRKASEAGGKKISIAKPREQGVSSRECQQCQPQLRWEVR